ncbi:MAG: DUF932 domain-containing protein [bacterium]|nr:DUF932 domain-containing protein [bacterium]
MSTTLLDAHKQWITRPPDERFPSLEAMLDVASHRKRESIENVRDVRSLRVYASHNGALDLNGHQPHATLTHWAFSQMCHKLGAPAGYLRTLPPEVAARCLEHGISQSYDECKILTRNGGKGDDHANLAAAFTSPTYGRIWDCDVLAALLAAIEGNGWHTPPSSVLGPSGLYASDRNMFAFLIHDEQPVEIGNAKLGRGFFLWNSETGAATFGLTTFLYNSVCQNHIVWGAEEVKELRIVHRDRAPDRFCREAVPLLNKFVESSAASYAIANVVHRAMYMPVGGSFDEVQAWFAGKPFTRQELLAGHHAGLSAGDDVSTVWGMIQGLTAAAQSLPHIDTRVSLERRAGALLR